MIDLKQIETDVLTRWEELGVYQRVKDRNRHAKGKKFYFLQGPPYTSGKLHIGQAWNSSLKDMIMRYKRMRGFDVWDRGGYDMHGLPTEQKVQKKLGLKDKEAIEQYGVDKFVKGCIDWSEEHAGYMSEDLWRMGIWMDHDNAYKPITKDYISGEWAFFKAAWDKKRLYKGLKTMHWDAETETGLAKHELEYKTITDTSVFLKFKKAGTQNEYFIIWTTTPWTIPFNLGIMVHPELEYVDVKVDDEIWTVAKDLSGVFISGLLGKKVDIVKTYLGEELKGRAYEHPLYDQLSAEYARIKQESPNAFTILLSNEYVNTLAGTGLVHCAPGCGPEDFEVGEQNGIAPFNTLNERGTFEHAGKFTGWEAKVDDPKFIAEFESRGILVAQTEVEHEYPHSDRSHKPVVFRTTEQWFLRTKDLAPELVGMNAGTHWVPRKCHDSYERWTGNLRDNSVARQRYWGCPLPIWVNENDEEDVLIIGSTEELEALTGKEFDMITLHKPYIDDVVIEKEGKTYRRIPDVADVWIDAGVASWNCLYNDPHLIEQYYPADVVLEATEQTRLWFSLLNICSAIRYEKQAFKNAYCTGMIYDFEGTKMSKSLGNIISPYEVIDKHSTDVLRYYLGGISAGENISFSWDEVKVRQRNLNILSNIGRYVADLETLDIPNGEPGEEERWIISRYHATLKEVTKLFEEYRLDETVSAVETLIMQLSRDYIKLVRDKAHSNAVVRSTIKEVFVGILKMFAPTCPFITDHIWQTMHQEEESVHLAMWPEYDVKQIDPMLEETFATMFSVIEKGLAERDRAQLGVKWPLANADVTISSELGPTPEALIKQQLNIKMLTFKQGDQVAITLDTTLTPDLEAEGFARELARRVQAERKKRGMQKTETIELAVYVEEGLREQISPHIDFIGQRTGATNVVAVDTLPDTGITFTVRKKELGFAF